MTTKLKTFPVYRCEGGSLLGHAIDARGAKTVWKMNTQAGIRGEPCRVEFDDDADCFYVYEVEPTND